jgi:hypothetical protein
LPEAKPYKKNDDAVKAYPAVMAQEIAEVQRNTGAHHTEVLRAPANMS